MRTAPACPLWCCASPFVYVEEVNPAKTASRKRSIVKAITYRVFIVCLDFTVIYILTGKVNVALGFMVVSNIYTTAGYFVHERVWARIGWGMKPAESANKGAAQTSAD